MKILRGVAWLSLLALVLAAATAVAPGLPLGFPPRFIFLGLVAFGVGGMAPRESSGAWGWMILVPMWGLYGVAAVAGWLQSHALSLGVYPLVASVGMAAGWVALGSIHAGWEHRLLASALAALAIGGLAVLAGVPVRGESRSSYYPPAFMLPRLGAGMVSSLALRGRPVVLSFWASWCPPCRAELPRLEEIYRRYHAHVRFFAVDVATGGETRTRARTFLRRHGITIPAVWDGSGRLARIFRTRRVVPVLVLLRPDGQVIFEHYGYPPDGSSLRQLGAYLKPWLRISARPEG